MSVCVDRLLEPGLFPLLCSIMLCLAKLACLIWHFPGMQKVYPNIRCGWSIACFLQWLLGIKSPAGNNCLVLLMGLSSLVKVLDNEMNNRYGFMSTMVIMQYKTLATWNWDQMCPSVTNTWLSWTGHKIMYPRVANPWSCNNIQHSSILK